jgi:hypothetical protein
MLRLLERNIAAIEERLILLAPSAATVGEGFCNVTFDQRLHAERVREMQRLRGSIYLEDGAIERRQLSTDGLHRTPEDEKSWHLLMLGGDGRISACAWYLEHPNTTSIQSLRVRNCPLAATDDGREMLHAAVEAEIARARQDGLRYAEVGGWAVSKHCRCTSEGLLLALGAYSLGRRLGGALGITTATVRHSSSTILRRLGGSNLEVGRTVVPSYFDPKYNCEMELLRFDSRRPNAKYTGLIELLRERLTNVSVIASDALVPSSAVPHYARPELGFGVFDATSPAFAHSSS